MGCVKNVLKDFILLMELSVIHVWIGLRKVWMLILMLSFLKLSINFMISIFTNVGIIVIIIPKIGWNIIHNYKPFKSVKISSILY
jgi:hypothetical protein